MIVGHLDRRIDPDYYALIARRRAWLQFDLLRDADQDGLRRRVALVLEQVRCGNLRRILISQDVCTREHLKSGGGHGYDRLVVEFVPMVHAAGISEEQVDILLQENPRRAITGSLV